MLTIDRFGRQIYGPYIESSKRPGKEKPRRFVVMLYGSGRKVKRKKTAYARWLMEIKLGRELTREETVDHDDEDTLNDAIENLKIMSHGDNIRKSHRGIQVGSRRWRKLQREKGRVGLSESPSGL